MSYAPAIAVVTVTGALAWLCVMDVRGKPAREAEAAAKAEVLLDGKAVVVHTVTDKAQGKTWRVIYVDRGVDRGAIVIPGSEQPIAVEKP